MSEAAAPPRHSDRSFAATSFSGLTALYALAIRQHLHGKRWLVISMLFLVPAALAVLVRLTPSRIPPEGLEFMLAMMLLPQLLIPLVALLYASGIMEDELEDQTITYLLIRPLPRWAIYLVNLLATITITLALTLLFTAVAFGAIYIGSNVSPSVWLERLAKIAALHALAITAYCCLFGLLSLLTKRALVLGVIYIAVIEGLLANLPFGVRLMTVIYYARILAYRTLSFVIAAPNGEHDAADETWQLNVTDDPDLLLQSSAMTCLQVLLIGSAVCAALGAAICSQREFHVKTPEKS